MSMLSKWTMALTCTALLLTGIMATRSAGAQTLTTLYNFTGHEGPTAPLVQATDGHLYGTTPAGGPDTDGTVFKITTSGKLNRLQVFDGSDGSSPSAGLIQATNGDFYGTTGSGGANGSGTVFQITPGGALTSLYSFCSRAGCTDGQSPEALLQGSDGNFYGTTNEGGAKLEGTVFRLTPGGTLNRLHSFCSQPPDCQDGSEPRAGLIQATDGNFYGTTLDGGANFSGTVFKITPSGMLTTLYAFCSQTNCADGFFPEAGLIQATDGNFYGTTLGGGAQNEGEVFMMTPGGTLTTLYSFCAKAHCRDGSSPTVALIQATDGDLYGTTQLGGTHGDGTVFKVTLSGALTTLYSFCSQTGCTDGAQPAASLMQATNGDLYGSTQLGGAHGAKGGGGTLFSLSVGLGPFVETQTTSGKVGAVVKILGTDLTGSTSVTFNGTAAAFSIVSASEISTAVPTGATTGYVEVVTPDGPLTSNVVYTVKP